MLQARNACLLAALTLVLGACTKDQTSFASLARRPAERISVDQPAPPAPPPLAAPDPALLTRLDAMAQAARSADERFRAAEAKTRALVKAAAGAEIASESWAVATVALADLEASRSQTVIVLADIDALYARAVVDGADSQAIAGARQAVLFLVAREDKVMAELNALLKS